MRDHFAVSVITSDRDLGGKQSYASITTGTWQPFDRGIRVMYCKPGISRIRQIHAILNESAHATVYLNSMFSRSFSLLPLWLLSQNQGQNKVILTPRGMLKPSALKIKAWKKVPFLRLLQRWQYLRQLSFHATNISEQEEIFRIFGEKSRISVVPNCTPKPQIPTNTISKNPGTLKVISVARIHPIKNTLFLIDAMAKVSQSVALDLYGPIEDATYWKLCQQRIRALPENVRVTYCGELASCEVRSHINRYHLFGLATRGENFGHAIYEALSTGTPVLISDQTPWRDLTKKRAGWDLSLNDIHIFTQVLEKVAGYSQLEYEEWSAGAYTVAEEFCRSQNTTNLYKNLFSNAA
ncbi:MAG: glycosyltransferase [Planctomycetota bacterium]|nr:glycosyltransferase [Planctomycetota bacterium]